MHEERIDARRIVFGPLDEALRAVAPVGPIALLGTPRSLAAVPNDALAAQIVHRYDGVRLHNPRETVREAGALIDAHGCASVIAIGSSSAMDLGKAASDGRSATLILIPTALYDAELLTSLPGRELGSIGINAWAHTIEAAYARTEHATGGAAAVVAGGRLPPLLRAAARIRDTALHDALFRAAHLAGYALDTRSMGLHHAVCHVVGGLTRIPHGIVNAIVLPHAVRANARLAPDAVEAVADWFEIDDLAGEAEAIARAFELPRSFAALGAPPDLVERAVPRVMDSPLLRNNPAEVDEPTVRALLTAAYGQ